MKRLESTDYVPTDKSWSLIKKEMSKKIKLLGEDVGAESVDKLKSELGDTLTKVFKKEKLGGALSNKEQARMAMFDALKDALDTVSPEIRQKNLLQKDIFDLAVGFDKKRNEKIILPVIGQLQGIPGVREGVQRVSAKAGGVVGGTGSILENILNAGGAGRPISTGAGISANIS